jgi:hypothetical protein
METAIIYRTNMELATQALKILNKKGTYIENIDYVLDENSLKNIAGVKNINDIKGVYVNENGRLLKKPTNKLIKYKDSYINFWKNETPMDNGIDLIYGNILIVLKKTAYNNLPAELKTTDVSNIDI